MVFPAPGGATTTTEYEWAQHVVIGKREGLSDDEITRIGIGADAPGWSDPDRALLRATDELWNDAMISDGTWRELSRFLNTEQLMDVVFTVGQYNLVSMALNSFGVQLDPVTAAISRRSRWMRVTGALALAVLASLSVGCSAYQPVLYPNSKLEQV